MSGKRGLLSHRSGGGVRVDGLPSDLDDYSSSDGEDDVFIPDVSGNGVVSSAAGVVGVATKVLLHPRRKTPSGGYQEIYHVQRVRRMLSRCLTGAFVLGVVASFVYLIALLVQSYREEYGHGSYGSESNRRKTFYNGCREVEKSTVWAVGLPQLFARSNIQRLDADEDGALDVALGFGTETDTSHPAPILCDLYFDADKPCQGGVLVVDGKTGKQLWRRNLYHEVTGLACEEDLNGDKVKDCVASGKAGTFAALDGKNGKVIWSYKPSEESPAAALDALAAVMLPDLNSDGVSDVLLTTGGASFPKIVADEGGATSGVSALKILDGQDGSVLSRAYLPVDLIVTDSPQLLRLKSGLMSLIFGTRRANRRPESRRKRSSVLRPGLTVVSLQDVFKGDLRDARVIFEAEAGVSKPLLVDLTHDDIDDVIFRTRGFGAVTLDGASLLQIWNLTEESTEGGQEAVILPIYYDDDDSLDFVVESVDDQGMTKVSILDGATGETLLEPDVDAGPAHPWRRTAEALKIRVDNYGNDLVLFAATDVGCEEATSCPSNERRQPRYQLRIVSSHIPQPGILIYDSHNATDSALFSRWVNASEKAMEFVEDHPGLWRIFGRFVNGEPEYDERDEEDVPPPRRYDWNSRGSPFRIPAARHRPPTYPATLEALSRQGDPRNSRYPSSERRRLYPGVDRWRDEAPWWNRGSPADGSREEDLTDSAEMPATLADWLMEDRGRVPSQKRYRRDDLHSRLEDRLKSRNLLSGMSSTALLLPSVSRVLNGSSRSGREDEIDIVFATHWRFPSPIDECVLKKRARRDGKGGYGERLAESMRSCIEEMSRDAESRPSGRRPRSDRGETRTTTRFPSEVELGFRNPFALEMGQTEVRRMRLSCSCGETERIRCNRFLPFEKQNSID